MDLLNLLIGKTVSLALEKGIIKSRSIIVDATHSLSRSNPYSPIEVLRQRSKLLRKAVYLMDDLKGQMPEKNDSNDILKEIAYWKLQKLIKSDEALSEIPAVKEKLNLLKETVENSRENYAISKDMDANVGHKTADSSFFWLQSSFGNDRGTYHNGRCCHLS